MQAGEFHWRDGIFFSRDEHGRVHIRIDAGQKVTPADQRPDEPTERHGWAFLPERQSSVALCIPPNEWASIIAHVCAGNGSADAYEKAGAFHG